MRHVKVRCDDCGRAAKFGETYPMPNSTTQRRHKPGLGCHAPKPKAEKEAKPLLAFVNIEVGEAVIRNTEFGIGPMAAAFMNARVG